MFYSKKLKKFKDIKHCFFSRKNGYSVGLYKSLNCGRGSKDSKKNIAKNLSFIADKMGVKKAKLILMNQTHSNKVIEIKHNNYKKKINADAIITKITGIGLCVLTADCVPILLYDKKNQIVGSIHAGWKGAFSRVIQNTILRIKKKNSNNLIYACVGPCIGKKSYEVDDIFFKKFLQKSRKNKKYFSKKNNNKKLFNLRAFVSDKLLELGVIVDHIKRDTFKESNNFFSYRRSSKLKQIDYGRCLSVIKLV
tara:strand:- start:616 stop:1368 length:753 start_codon:yes stop_codon:yes gene_type:complete